MLDNMASKTANVKFVEETSGNNAYDLQDWLEDGVDVSMMI